VSSDAQTDAPASSVEHRALSDLLQSHRPAVYFDPDIGIGDYVLTLPTLRALAQMFTAPLTVICPKVAFDLCFRELSPRLVDATGFAPDGLPRTLGAPITIDCETLASQIGAVDVLINTVAHYITPGRLIGPLLQVLTPGTTVGFNNDYEEYDVVVPKEAGHSADLMFKLARLFDPAVRIEPYAQPVPVPPSVAEEARSIRAAVAPQTKVLVVHADTDWTAKRWPITRFIDLLDRFLLRHRDFVAWIVGMGHEELNAGSEGDRIISYLGLPLDLSMGLVANADFFLGIDSCMLHAADLARVPGVGMFGPTRSTTWGFRFGPHRHIDARTMADITVEEVLGAMEDLVNEHA
jgi:ADP-heptose:LPS heptosyltransferase